MRLGGLEAQDFSHGGVDLILGEEIFPVVPEGGVRNYGFAQRTPLGNVAVVFVEQHVPDDIAAGRSGFADVYLSIGNVSWIEEDEQFARGRLKPGRILKVRLGKDGAAVVHRPLMAR